MPETTIPSTAATIRTFPTRAQVRYQQSRSAARMIRRAELLELSSQDDAALEAELAAYELQRICRNGEVMPDAGRIETFEHVA